MSWSNDVTIIVDDTLFAPGTPAGQVKSVLTSFPSGVWDIQKPLGFSPVNDTFSFVNSQAGGDWFFDGTAISLFGMTPNATSIQTFAQGATAGQLRTTSYPDPPGFYGQFFTSPDLDPVIQQKGTGNAIAVNFQEGLAIDYALIKVSNQTHFQGQTIIVDDANSEIEWNGNWTERSNYFLELPNLSAFGTNLSDPSVKLRPHGNGTKTSGTEGDSFTFQFAGTSILIAGTNPSLPGSGTLTMNFKVDDKSTQRTFTFNPRFTDSTLPGLPNFVYFSDDALSSGSHNLTVELTHVEGNITATIDYLTYKPSFDRLADKPVFSSQTSSPDLSSSKHSVNAGVIAGAVIGSLVLVALIAGFGFWWLRRRKRMSARRRFSVFSERPATDPDDPKAEMYVTDPFTSTAPSNGSFETNPASAHTLASHQNPYSGKRAELQRERDELARNMDNLQSQYNTTPYPSDSITDPSERAPQSSNRDLEAEMREMRAKMDMLTNEMSRYMVPPAYDNNNGRAS